ncbi:Ycf66 family protein [Planktothrix pseudagardhii]|uniref:Bromodomain-containing protein 4 n=1 Tax=Planktothrix pseudagardhii TaxID=132604 RepID=A0A9W4CSU5_9CYAN|nr:Ycf66 family protein [Planktothrix pseudagardhii]CAD5913030.1 Bromodomain-containing protein 4 [Planktothrix pseudagardhii]
MLAYILAIAVGLGSFALYMAAFFFPEVHRKSDFVWSGVGLFYALVLWACAGRITGAVLLGQVASVSLLVWFGWEALMLRRAGTPVAQQTPIPADVKERLNSFLSPQPPVISPQSKPPVNIVNPPQPASKINPVIPEPPVETRGEPKPEPEIIATAPDVAAVQDDIVVEEPPISAVTPELEVTVEEIAVTPNLEPTPSPVETPQKLEQKPPISSGRTPSKTVAKPQKSIPELAGMVSGWVGNLTGLFNKKPKIKTPKPTTTAKSPKPDSAPSTSTVVESTPSSQADSVGSEFAEFEDIETTVSSTPNIPEVVGIETEPPTKPEATETVEKPTPSPFEQLAAPQVEVVVEITAEQVNLIVEDTQESVVVDPADSETVEETITVSEAETSAEATESEETTPPALVRPHPPNPDLKAATQKPTDSNSPSEPKPE